MTELRELPDLEIPHVLLTRVAEAGKVSGMDQPRQQTELGIPYLVVQGLHDEAAYPS